MVRIRVSLVLITALVVAGVAADAPAAKRWPASKEWGGITSALPGARGLVLETRAAPGKGKKARYPVWVNLWGVYGTSAPCESGGNAGYPIPRPIAVSHQGPVTTTVQAYGPRLRVRKHRFSHRGSFVVPEHGLKAQVSYVLKGRFLSPSRAKGTVGMKVVQTFYDGRVVRCSGSVSWTACTGDLNTLGPPKKACLGKHPYDVESPGVDVPVDDPVDDPVDHYPDDDYPVDE